MSSGSGRGEPESAPPRPVVGQTYQLEAVPDPLGGTRWNLFDYRRVEGVRMPTWFHIGSLATDTPPAGTYRDVAAEVLNEFGYDIDAMDLLLKVPDGSEWLRPRRPGS